MKSCRVLVFSFTLGALLFLTPGLVEAKSDTPNIVFILADDMGFSDLGCYGAVKIQTPNLDRLAADGLRFTQMYSTARCWPSRTCLMSGFYAQQTLTDPLPGQAKNARSVTRTILPVRLKAAGYRSYHSGKWHIQPDRKRLPFAESGFADSYTVDDHNRFFYPKQHTLNGKPLPPVKPGTGYYATTAIMDHAIQQLQDHAAHHAGEPFFQYVAFIAPHFPLQAPKADIDKYRDAFLEGWDVIRAQRTERLKELGFPVHPPYRLEPEIFPPWNLRGKELLEQVSPAEVDRAVAWDSLTDEQKRYQATKMAIHAAMVDRLDQEVGRLIAQLKTMDAYDDTIIMFGSDNGASAEILNRGDRHTQGSDPGSGKSFLCLGPGWSSAANSPFRLHKSWTHEGGISSPFIVHWPAGIKQKGAFRHTPAHFVDVAITVLHLAGLEWPANEGGHPLPPTPGRDLRPSFNADVTIDRDFIWWFHSGHSAIRMGDWKAVALKDVWELYDLSKDRGETTDLAQKEPERLKRLINTWENFQREAVEQTKRAGEK